MAYLYDGIAKTQTGKIIYRRKKHLFNPKDIERLIKRLGFPDDSEGLYNWLRALQAFLLLAAKVENAALRAHADALWSTIETYVKIGEEFLGLGGGPFGGAGASGTFWDIFKSPFPTEGRKPEE